tara:strand:+ start:389 stop:1309 length:921 start_codon:yes stop_codon:yes gene_type:complete
MKIDTNKFRKALGKFTTGITIVTTLDNNQNPRGFTANSFTSVSLAPPLILICIGDFNESLDLFKNSDFFAVNILNENQKEISNTFASPSKSKFKGIDWDLGKFNSPLIKNSIAWFECKNYNHIFAGDHLILIGEVKNFGDEEGFPLGYFQGNYFSLNTENSLVNVITKSTQTIIGVIFENNKSILFHEDKKTRDLTLPCIGENNEKASTSNLLKKYNSIGFKGKLDFIYSVYEDKKLDKVCIYYRSKINSVAPYGLKYINFLEIPWDKIKDEALVIMLKRYIEESNHDNFAIYMGDETSGLTQKLK